MLIKKTFFTNYIKIIDTSFQGMVQERVQINNEPAWLKYRASSYWFSDDTKYWDDAEQVCKDKDSHLVSIKSDGENDFVLKNRKDKSIDTWIGAHRNGNDLNKWYWSNGEIVGFTSWKPGQPNEVSQHCAALHGDGDGLWHDTNCNRSFRYICEK